LTEIWEVLGGGAGFSKGFLFPYEAPHGIDVPINVVRVFFWAGCEQVPTYFFAIKKNGTPLFSLFNDFVFLMGVKICWLYCEYAAQKISRTYLKILFVRLSHAAGFLFFKKGL
jgi:hypothetical protein